MGNDLRANLTLGNMIGSGAFGSVYEAMDPIHGKVAVKVISKLSDEIESDWQGRKRDLLHEGQRLKEAEHDNVVRVFQILESESDDAIYLVMEYCSNGCLNDYFERGPMSLLLLRNLLTDAAFGIQAIHSRGMLHRDIKPSNILITPTQQAKVADFGLVTNDIVLGYASACGYLDHLAPEVFRDGQMSIRADVWAFGMTIYRLLHGKSFYEELPLPRHLVKAGNFAEKLPWLPHIPRSWRTFVRRTMNDDPNSRVQSATELLRHLKKLPISPDWTCEYTTNTVKWHRHSGKNRIVQVVWTRHSSHKHEWEAKSYPIGTIGRSMRLAGSTGIVSKKEAQRGLTAFFDPNRS